MIRDRKLGPDPDTQGQDLVQIMHRIYRELLLVEEEYIKQVESALEMQKKSLPVSTEAWKRLKIDTFADGINHGLMPSTAGFLQRVIKKCGKSPWSVIAHVHECAELKAEDSTHAHVCGFYAVRIEEGAPAIAPVKLTFPLVHATDSAWVMALATDIHHLFTLTGSQFYWDTRRQELPKAA